MSGVRVLVGTKKGAFVLTSDGKRQASALLYSASNSVHARSASAWL